MPHSKHFFFFLLDLKEGSMNELESGRIVVKDRARKGDMIFLIMYILPPPIPKGHSHSALHQPLEIASQLPT